MTKSQHIGIVAVSAEGAALCYRTICVEGAALFGTYDHPEITMHTVARQVHATSRAIDGMKLGGSCCRRRRRP